MTTRPIPERRLFISEVEELTGRSRKTLHRYVQAGTFPLPNKENGQNWWTESVIDCWVKGQWKAD